MLSSHRLWPRAWSCAGAFMGSPGLRGLSRCSEVDRSSCHGHAPPRRGSRTAWGAGGWWRRSYPPSRRRVAASDPSAISSVACGPMRWMPRTAPVSPWAMTLAKPSVSPAMTALAMAVNGTLPIATGQAPLLARLLGQADRGDLRPRVGGARLVDVVHRVDVRVAGDRVDGREALVRRRVREPQAADDVADRVDVRLGRPHVPVDLDDPAGGPHAGGLEAQVLDVGRPAGRDEDAVGRDLARGRALGPDREADPVLAARRARPGRSARS